MVKTMMFIDSDFMLTLAEMKLMFLLPIRYKSNEKTYEI